MHEGVVILKVFTQGALFQISNFHIPDVTVHVIYNLDTFQIYFTHITDVCIYIQKIRFKQKLMAN